MQEKVARGQIEDVDELVERIKAAWEELDHHRILAILQSNSSALAFVHLSQQTVAALGTSCLN